MNKLIFMKVTDLDERGRPTMGAEMLSRIAKNIQSKIDEKVLIVHWGSEIYSLSDESVLETTTLEELKELLL